MAMDAPVVRGGDDYRVEARQSYRLAVIAEDFRTRRQRRCAFRTPAKDIAHGGERRVVQLLKMGQRLVANAAADQRDGLAVIGSSPEEYESNVRAAELITSRRVILVPFIPERCTSERAEFAVPGRSW